MHKIIAFFGLIVPLISRAQVQKINAETSIQLVTVFSSGARVERSSAVNLFAGRSEISFAGLSSQLDPQTVQLKADADIVLLSVQSNKDFLSQHKIGEKEQEFIEHINSMKDKIESDEKMLEVYKNEEAMLEKNQSIGGQAGLKTADLKEAVEFQQQRLTEVYGKELEIQKKVADEKHSLEKIQHQLKEIGQKMDSVSYIVTALVDSRQAHKVNLVLSYNIADAGWYPSYDVRVTEVTDPMNVLMNAHVFQRSGESWKNIPLQLSTGSPKENATPTELQPWMLGFYDPSVTWSGQGVMGECSGRVTNVKGEPVIGATVMLKGARGGTATDANGYFKLSNVSRNSLLEISSVGYENKELLADLGYINVSLKPIESDLNEVVVTGYAAGVQDEENKPFNTDRQKKRVNSIQTVSVTAHYQPSTVIYKIDEKYTIESDGKTTDIIIKQTEIPTLFDYYSVPKVDASAFLTARIINWRDFDLQSGEASLYMEGTYLGKTYIDLGAAEDTLSISLGKDKGILVSRKLVKEFSTKKFIGSNRTDSRQYAISVSNSKHVPVNIRIVDQIPVSTTKEIEVEDVELSNAQLDKETGLANWILALAPGQTKELGVKYSVKYPKDKRVVLE